MNVRNRAYLLVLFAFVLWFDSPAFAEEGMKRTVIDRVDLSGAPHMEVISSILEVKPGTLVPRHFHHGIESGQVLEGAMIQFPGKEPQLLAAGAPIFNLRGVMHAGFTVVGEKNLKLYSVHIVDKGKPLAEHAQSAAE